MREPRLVPKALRLGIKSPWLKVWPRIALPRLRSRTAQDNLNELSHRLCRAERRRMGSRSQVHEHSTRGARFRPDMLRFMRCFTGPQRPADAGVPPRSSPLAARSELLQVRSHHQSQCPLSRVDGGTIDRAQLNTISFYCTNEKTFLHRSSYTSRFLRPRIEACSEQKRPFSGGYFSAQSNTRRVEFHEIAGNRLKVRSMAWRRDWARSVTASVHPPTRAAREPGEADR